MLNRNSAIPGSEMMSEYYDTGVFSSASIAFDLDGTLVDTAPDLVRALNAIIVPRGLSPVPLNDVRALVGRGAQALIERAYSQQDKDISAEEALSFVPGFIEAYQADIIGESAPYPGVIETLEKLQKAGAILSVCTNKPSILADQIIKGLGLNNYFTRIIGPDRTTAKKPSADHVIDAVGSGFSYMAMVGDSSPDVDAAKAAGIPSIVMSYGYSEKPASSLGADRLIHSFSNVPKTLVELWST
jgi:phosphoglycolate phosphatase